MSKFKIECGVGIYKFMSLTIMQLLSVLFKCRIYYLFNYYFRIFKPVLGLLFEHTLIILSFILILKIYLKHIIKGIIFFSIATFTS